MERIEIDNGIISLDLPEGFRVMTQEDAAKAGKRLSKNEWGANSSSLHFIIGVSWKKTPLFIDVPTDKIAGNTERKISKVIKTYKKLKNVTLQIDGKASSGLRYSYSVGESNMISDYHLIKSNGQYIAFTAIGRAESFDRNYHIFEETIKSVKLK